MRMGLVAVDRAAVHLRRPDDGEAAVLGEVDERVAQLLVAGEPEGHRQVLTRRPGRWGRTGETGQRLGGREALADVADLGPGGRLGQQGNKVG